MSRIRLIHLSLLLLAMPLSAVAQTPPATDPDYDGPPIGLLPELAGQHPRLLFDAARLEEIKAFHDSPEGKKLRDRLANAAHGFAEGELTTSLTTNEGASIRMGTSVMPSVALHYLMTGEQESLDNAITALQYLLDLNVWSGGNEPNSGMPAGNLLTGAALTYDMLYHHLDPVFRETVRARIWYQARALYHLGHLQKNPGTHYWQQDPQNNHRFHRLGGLVTGVLAAYEGDPDQDWMLSETMAELGFITRWLPPDGSNHEGITYIGYGMDQLLFAALASDHVMGTDYLVRGYFRNIPMFLTMATTPDLYSRFRYGDDGGSNAAMNNLHFPAINRNNLSDVQAYIDSRNPLSWGEEWVSLVTHQDPPAGGSLDNLPRNVRFPDLGVHFFHGAWNSKEPAAMFKCGPLGGHRLNEYRDTNNFHYINVAHDDPDANSFQIWDGWAYSAHQDGYSYAKRSSSHNTILVNGKGQAPLGEPEGMQWSQPTDYNVSMQAMAYVTNWKNRESIAIAEGEASGSYPSSPVNRFRRSFIWNNGKYILIFDDIRAMSEASITWLYQGEEIVSDNPDTGDYICWTRYSPRYFQVIATQPYNSQIGISTAQNRGSLMNFDQLRAGFSGVTNLQIACVLKLWDTAVSAEIESIDADHATITITGEDFTDVWSWTAAEGDNDPGVFVLVSSDGQEFASHPDPWLDAFPGFSYDRKDSVVSTWFGEYYPGHFPWVHHSGLGWMLSLYSQSPSEDGWMWQPGAGWIWSNPDCFPWVWKAASGDWIVLEQEG